ncbi:hypothetical protein BX667DRAFT_518389 [Coemansia mojavensis]|nr:hypothetical protein BX667DRAFT_518389 [Coemansia mojavensis]
MRAKAIYACDAENIGEVSFTAQDTLAGIQDSAEDGWLVGTVDRTGQRGLFPAVYTELSPETGDDIAFLQKLQQENLLSSTLKLEAFRRDLDSGRMSTSVSSANHSYSASSTFERTQTSYSSVSTGQQAPPVPNKPKLATRPIASIAGPSSGSRALPPPVPSKTHSASPPAVPPKPKSVASPSYASSASSQTMSPATSFSQSLGSQTTTSVRADSINASEQEAARQREAEAARAWENAHLAKKPTSLDGSREVSRLFGGVDSASKPNYATKPAVSIPRTAVCKPATASKPAVAPKPAALAESSKPVSQKPQVPSKPAVLRSTAEQIDLDSERDAAASWEAKHGIGKKPQNAIAGNSTKPAVMPMRKPATSGFGIANGYKPPVVKFTAKAPAAPPLPSKPSSLNSSNASSWSASNQAISQQQTTHTSSATTQRSNPATENDAPPLPHNPARAAVMSELLQARKPVPSVNPATANDAPALPYSPVRAAIVKPAEKPVESVIQPAPRSLISRMNSQTTQTLSKSSSSSSSMVGFGDSFDPASRQMPLTQQYQSSPAARSAINSQSSFHHSYSSVTSSEEKSISTSSAIPLTQSREVRGALPFTSAGAHDNHSVQHYSLTSKSSSSSFSKQESFTSSGINPVSTISMFKLQEYSRIFQALNAQEGSRGYLSSEAVRNQVARSSLPDDQLRRIWQLADRNLNGKFGPGEFNIIMHLVDCAQLNYPIPNSLPVDLLHIAYA